MDVVIPIVFPEYTITVNTPQTEVDILPWVEFDNITIPASKQRFSDLGHAGVLFINGENGLTKYFEYGRYDRAGLGLVRRVPIPNVELNGSVVTRDSLKKALKKIARVAGRSTRIEGVYIDVKNKFSAMLKYAERRKLQNADPTRRPYNLTSNSCIHFVKSVTEKADIDTPWMVDPRPTSYIGEFRDDFPDLDYRYASDSLTIGD